MTSHITSPLLYAHTHCLLPTFIMLLFLSSFLLAGAAIGAPAKSCPSPVQPGATAPKPPTGVIDVPPASTPSPLQAGVALNCNKFYQVQRGEECTTVAMNFNLTLDVFRSYNAGIDQKCGNLAAFSYACVAVNGTPITPKIPPGNIVDNPATPPSPLQLGVVANCDKYYQVQSGEICNTVASYFNITFPILRIFNAGIDETCTNLAADAYACVSVDGEIPASPAAKYQPGAVENCVTYYTVTNGQDCNTVAQKNGITVSDLLKFNTGINEKCTNLVAGADACVDITGFTPATPSDIRQPGFVGNCKKSVKVPKGSTCDGFAKDNGINFAKLRELNTGIDENCSNLLADALACVAA